MLMRVVKYVMQVIHRERLRFVPLDKWHCVICGAQGKIMENEILTSFNERPQPLIRFLFAHILLCCKCTSYPMLLWQNRDIVVIICGSPDCDKKLKGISKEIGDTFGTGIRKAVCHWPTCGKTESLLSCSSCRIVYCKYYFLRTKTCMNLSLTDKTPKRLHRLFKGTPKTGLGSS